MKKISLSLLALAGLLVTAESRAASVDGVVYAEIEAPLEISEDSQLDFGVISVDGNSGTVSVDEFGGLTCPSDMYCDGNTTNGSYTVTGATDAMVNVSITDPTLSDGSGNTMSVSTLDDSGTDLVGGTMTFNVGGNLSVDGSQAQGTYSSDNVGGTAMTIDVDYQ